jgi:Zn-dependent M28 family amino/carboxypeptidase
VASARLQLDSFCCAKDICADARSTIRLNAGQRATSSRKHKVFRSTFSRLLQILRNTFQEQVKNATKIITSSALRTEKNSRAQQKKKNRKQTTKKKSSAAAASAEKWKGWMSEKFIKPERNDNAAANKASN